MNSKHQVLQVEAVNYTPLMAGDALGIVITSMESQTLALAHLSKPLIGKSRWLLRTLIQALGYASSHRDAEIRPTLTIYMGKRDKELRIGLVKLLFGSINPAWRALYTIKTIPKNGYKVDRDSYYLRNSRWTVTRYKLATMGAEQGREEKAPIEPRSLTLQVEVLRRPLPGTQITTPSGATVRLEDLDTLTAGLVLGVLRILGIGQGANRGFGRFTLNNDAKNDTLAGTEEVRELVQLLSSLDNPTNRVDETLRRYFETLASIITRLNGDTHTPDTSVYIKSYWINSNIAQCIERKIYQKLPGMRGRELPRDPLYRNLELIAIATLKTAWKAINGEQRSGGAAYHTWILGLPRRQKISNPRRCKSQVPGDAPTGYLLDHDYWGETGTQLIPVDNKGELYTVGKSGKKFVDGRRQSPIILFPLDPEGRVITVIGFKPGDLADLVGSMYHAGGLVNTRVRRPIFVDVIRLAGVGKISSRGINRVKYTCREGRYVNIYVNDRAVGVARPGVKTHRDSRPVQFNSDSELVKQVYEAALEFIGRILTMRRCEGHGWYR